MVKTGVAACAASLLLAPAALASGATEPSGATGPVDQTTSAPTAATAADATQAAAPSAQAVPRIELSVGGTYRRGSRSFVLKGALVKLNGSVDGNYDGLVVKVTIERNGKTVLEKDVKLKAAGGKSRFELHYRIRRAGYHRFAAKVENGEATTPDAAESKFVSVVTSNIKRGAHGIAVRVIQDKLDRLGYVVSNNGTFDAATGRALKAFRKVNGMARTETAGKTVGSKLARNRGGFKPKTRKYRHIEVDLSRQVMAFIDGGKVTRTYHVSTGTGSTPTVRGHYRVYRKDYGTNAKGMVHSSYFIRGYAIHGFASVPTYNASHGCVRVPVPDANSIFSWVRMGERVYVYR